MPSVSSMSLVVIGQCFSRVIIYFLKCNNFLQHLETIALRKYKRIFQHFKLFHRKGKGESSFPFDVTRCNRRVSSYCYLFSQVQRFSLTYRNNYTLQIQRIFNLERKGKENKLERKGNKIIPRTEQKNRKASVLKRQNSGPGHYRIKNGAICPLACLCYNHRYEATCSDCRAAPLYISRGRGSHYLGNI